MTDLANRALAVLVFGACAVACAAMATALVLPAQAPAIAGALHDASLGAAFDDAVRAEAQQPFAALAFAACALLAALLVALEVRPPSRRARVWQIALEGPGRTAVDLGTLDEVAERASLDVEGIERIHARVTPRDRELHVAARAHVSPFVELEAAGAQVERAIAERLERLTGARVSRVDVRAVLAERSAPRRVR